jgi:hypothetical protein
MRVREHILSNSPRFRCCALSKLRDKLTLEMWEWPEPQPIESYGVSMLERSFFPTGLGLRRFRGVIFAWAAGEES